MAEYHALSRNLMHQSITITDKVYAHVEEAERGRLLTGLGQNSVAGFDDEFLVFIQKYNKEDLTKAITMLALRLGNL
jgi:hypothetical protein